MTTLCVTALIAVVIAGPPVAERGREKDWTVRFRLRFMRDDIPRQIGQSDISAVPPAVFSSIRMDSTFTDHHEDETQAKYRTMVIKGQYYVPATFEAPIVFQDGHLPGSGSARIVVEQGKERADRYEFEQNKTCYETRVREDLAELLRWPGEWPLGIEGALKPQPFIESQDETIEKLVDEWTRGRVTTVPPYLAAKAITGAVLEHVQPTGDLRKRGDTALLNVSGARSAAVSRRGTDIDLICLHVACLRAAGIPARPVVGLHARDEKLMVWSEFYAYDAEEQAGYWLPVDLMKLRAASSRVPPIDRPWRFFGNVKDYHEYVPLTYELVVIEGGVPSLCHWREDDSHRRPYIAWEVYSTPNRGGRIRQND
jgi:hypothetical protein